MRCTVVRRLAVCGKNDAICRTATRPVWTVHWIPRIWLVRHMPQRTASSVSEPLKAQTDNWTWIHHTASRRPGLNERCRCRGWLQGTWLEFHQTEVLQTDWRGSQTRPVNDTSTHHYMYTTISRDSPSGKGYGDTIRARCEPITRVCGQSRQRDPSKCKAPSQGIKGRSRPEFESFEAFVRLKADPKFRCQYDKTVLNMASVASKQTQPSSNHQLAHIGPSFVLGRVSFFLVMETPGGRKCTLAHACGRPWLQPVARSKHAHLWTSA